VETLFHFRQGWEGHPVAKAATTPKHAIVSNPRERMVARGRPSFSVFEFIAGQ
jgi:hypothetical protein